MELDGNGKSAKYVTNTLSKVWKPFQSLHPFYDGGKISIGKDERFCCCLHDSKLIFFSVDNKFEYLGEIGPENEEIICYSLAPNGTELVTFSRNLLMRQWSCITFECQRTIKGHKMPVLTMDYDQTSTLVATGSTDNVVRVWDIERGYCTHSFKYHRDIIKFLKFHPNPQKNILFSSSDDSTIKVYNLQNSTCIGDFSNHILAPTDIALTNDHEIMVSVGRDKVINFYQLGNMTHLKTLAVLEELESVLILPPSVESYFLTNNNSGIQHSKKRKQASSLSNESILITAGEKGILRFFRVQYENVNAISCNPLIILRVDDGCIFNSSLNDYFSSCGVTSIQLMIQKQKLFITTTDHRIALFPLTNLLNNTKVQTTQFVGSFDDILGISIVPSNNSTETLSVSTLNDNLTSNIQYTNLPLLDGMRIAIVSNSPVVHVLDNNSSSLPLVGHTDIVLTVQCSIDGNWIVTSSKDTTCRVWNTSTLSCIGIGSGHTDSVSSIALSQRIGAYQSKFAVFISGGGDKVLKRWNFPFERFNSNQVINLISTHSVRAHDKDINSIAISPNDALVASCSHDTNIRIWNCQDLSAVTTLTGHKKGVWCVRFSPVDKCLASCGGDRTLKLWSLTDYSCLRTFQGHTASVLSVQFVRHGMQLVSAAADGLLYLWTIRTGERENILDKHTEKIWGLEKIQFNDAEILLSCGSDSKIISWYDATPEEEEKQLELHEKVVLLEQQLANKIRLGQYSEALNIAFELQHPNKILNILKTILNENEIQLNNNNTDSDNNLSENCLNKYVKKLSVENLQQILNYAKEWNTNSRHTKVVHTLFQSIIQVFGVANLSLIPSISDIISSFSSFSDRHYQRIDRLHESIYLLEYLDNESSLIA